MRAHQEQSEADTLVYVDIKKIASELEEVEIDVEETDVEAGDIEELGDLDVAPSLRASHASIPPQAPVKARSRYPLAVFALLLGLATLAFQAEKTALPGAMSRLDTMVMRVRARIGAPLLRASLSSSAAGAAPTSLPAPEQAVATVTTEAAPAPQRATVSSGPRADATLDRARGFVAGSIFEILPDFASEDGKYDLIVHFHGGASVVAPEFARARLNAVLVVVNLGLASGSYDQSYVSGLLFPTILSNVTRTLAERGLRAPSPRRLAVTAWSAGYAAVKRILDEPGAIEQIDSVILLDGLHTAFLSYPKRPDPSHLAMFVRFGKEAVAGRKLLSITHSEIDPFEFVGAHKSTDLLLDDVGVSRRAVAPDVAGAGAAPVGPAKVKWPMELTSEAHEGGLFVRGYAGVTKEDHCAQVGQMANTALPDLATRWASPVRD
jgi:hypothetical protein